MSEFFKSDLGRFRLVSLLEGLSYVVLLGFAMPLKYVWNEPMWVRITGSAHGFLFVLLCALLLRVSMTARWPLKKMAMAFVLALLPLGAFYLEHLLRKEPVGDDVK